MDLKLVTYLVYLLVSVTLTIWVARTLLKNGQVFLDDAFEDGRLAVSVNHLLVVGFYLLNLGYVSVAMRDGATVDDTATAMERLSVKIGLVLLVLGVVHLFNVFALGRYRRNRMRQAALISAHHPPMPPAPIPMPPIPH